MTVTLTKKKKKKDERDRHREIPCDKASREWVKCLQAKEHQGLPVGLEAKNPHRATSPLGLSERA